MEKGKGKVTVLVYKFIKYAIHGKVTMQLGLTFFKIIWIINLIKCVLRNMLLN